MCNDSLPHPVLYLIRMAALTICYTDIHVLAVKTLLVHVIHAYTTMNGWCFNITWHKMFTSLPYLWRLVVKTKHMYSVVLVVLATNVSFYWATRSSPLHNTCICITFKCPVYLSILVWYFKERTCNVIIFKTSTLYSIWENCTQTSCIVTMYNVL